MARTSNKEAVAAALAAQDDLNKKSEERAMTLFTGFMTQFMEKIGAARVAAGDSAAPANPVGDRGLAAELAHAMMIASATPERRATLIAPEEQKIRDEARKALVDLLMDNQAKGIVPAYKVTRKTFLAEMLVDPEYQHPTTKTRVQREVNWRGIPNQAMAPIIRPSRDPGDQIAIDAGSAVYALYTRSIGRTIINANQASQWVTNGKELLRATPETEAASAPNIAPGLDPAKMSQMEGIQTVRMLGKTAEPAALSG